jgi:hypothetical protein
MNPCSSIKTAMENDIDSIKPKRYLDVGLDGYPLAVAPPRRELPEERMKERTRRPAGLGGF